MAVSEVEGTMDSDILQDDFSDLESIAGVWDDSEWCLGDQCPYLELTSTGSKICHLDHNQGRLKSRIKPEVCMYKRALRTLTDDDLFRCDICGKELYTPESWIEHIENVHSNINNIYQCDMCGRLFPKKNLMESHKKRKHQ